MVSILPFGVEYVARFPLHLLLYKNRVFGTQILKVFSFWLIAQKKNGYIAVLGNSIQLIRAF